MGKQYTSSEIYFDGRQRHRPGEVFTLPDGAKPGRSMVEVDAKPKPAKGKAKQEPTTMSELARAAHNDQGDNALV
jgi:hypothetical protein